MPGPFLGAGHRAFGLSPQGRAGEVGSSETKSRQALEDEGYNLKRWQAVEMSKTSDPDGNRDKFLNRTDVASGTILFSDSPQSSPKYQRVVKVELKGNRLECRVSGAE